MSKSKWHWVNINGRWVKHYPQGRPTNAQRINEYFDGVKRAQSAARVEAFKSQQDRDNEQTATLLALVIAARPILDTNIRKSVLAIRDANNLPHADTQHVINKYKEFLWNQANP